jgi:hypothetical protein
MSKKALRKQASQGSKREEESGGNKENVVVTDL